MHTDTKKQLARDYFTWLAADEYRESRKAYQSPAGRARCWQKFIDAAFRAIPLVGPERFLAAFLIELGNASADDCPEAVPMIYAIGDATTRPTEYASASDADAETRPASETVAA